MLAIWARCRYGFFRKARNIGFRMAPWGTPGASREAGSWLPGVAEGAGGGLRKQTPHPPAPPRGARLVPPQRATPVAHARRTPALDEPAAPTKSAAAPPPPSATATKDDEAGPRAQAAPSAGTPRFPTGTSNNSRPRAILATAACKISPRRLRGLRRTKTLPRFRRGAWPPPWVRRPRRSR